jgi:2-phosphosulfolactate phosphatase
MARGSVVIDCFPDSAHRYLRDHVIVAIDVIRATTTATTALDGGRRVIPCQTTDDAFVIASRLQEPLLVGELGGNMPVGFDLTNSPYLISRRDDIHRPMILLSSSGTQLLLNAAGAEATYIACLRNISAVAAHLALHHPKVAVLGAGTRGQFRREDQIGCAWLAEKLLDCGYGTENRETLECVRRWKNVDLEVIREGRSAAYLKKSGQEMDLEFVLGHLDDLEIVPTLVSGELVEFAETPALYKYLSN